MIEGFFGAIGLILGAAYLIIMGLMALTTAVSEAKERFFDEPMMRELAQQEKERQAYLDSIESEIESK